MHAYIRMYIYIYVINNVIQDRNIIYTHMCVFVCVCVCVCVCMYAGGGGQDSRLCVSDAKAGGILELH
jgi:hypothetical protein